MDTKTVNVNMKIDGDLNRKIKILQAQLGIKNKQDMILYVLRKFTSETQ
jgi:hypothetical protein